MKDALKKLDRKFLIFASCLILIPVVIIIFLAIIQGCGNRKVTYDKYEQKMIAAAKKYIDKNDSIPKEESEYIVVELNTLVSNDYIKSTEKLLDDDSCNGSVTVIRNGVDLENENEGYLNYTVNLECDKYKTNNLKTLVLEDLTSDGSGLYKIGENYIFRGQEVNNYIKFYDTLYRIVSIDKNGMAKLLKVERESQKIYWDMKYNTDVDNTFGKNIYQDSYILQKLNKYYNDKIKEDVKTKIVAVDVCVDARDINNGNLAHTNECQSVLKNQKITLLNVNDFANASTDPECNGIYSKSCKNYNYMGEMSLYTWTKDVVSNNTYQVYYLSNGYVRSNDANKYNSYNIVLHISSLEKVSSGKGTEKEPYVIK